MKVRCPECEESFDVSVNDYDEGDMLDCPECCTELTIKVSAGKLKLITEKECYYDSEEFGEEEED